MPLFHEAVAFALAGHGEAVKLAREAHSEVGDVDSFLNFAPAFLENLADFEAEEATEGVFVGAEFIADCADEEAALWGGDFAPVEECGVTASDRGVVAGGVIEGDSGDGGTVDCALACVHAVGREACGGEARVVGVAELGEELRGLVCHPAKTLARLRQVPQGCGENGWGTAGTGTAGERKVAKLRRGRRSHEYACEG